LATARQLGSRVRRLVFDQQVYVLGNNVCIYTEAKFAGTTMYVFFVLQRSSSITTQTQCRVKY
jgi:hypothetical protein